MKHWFLVVFVFTLTGLQAQNFVFPSGEGWRVLTEGQTLSFSVDVSDSSKPRYSLEGVNGY